MNETLNDIPTPNIRTRYGREIKPVQQYIPSMAGGQKYEETINTNIEVHEYDSVSAIILAKIIDNYNNSQYNLKKGIKLFGDRGRDAAFQELNQLHKRAVFNPVNMD